MVRIGFGQREVGLKKVWLENLDSDTPPGPPPPPKKKKQTNKQTNKKQNKKKVDALAVLLFCSYTLLDLDATVRRRQRGQYIIKRFNERKKCLCTSLNIWGNFSTVLCEKTTLLTSYRDSPVMSSTISVYVLLATSKRPVEKPLIILISINTSVTNVYKRTVLREFSQV